MLLQNPKFVNIVGETVSCVVAIDAAGVRLPYDVIFGFSFYFLLVAAPCACSNVPVLGGQTIRGRTRLKEVQPPQNWKRDWIVVGG